MSRAVAFERYWSDFERPSRPVEESLPPTPGLAGAVATATVLHLYGEALPDMDLDSAWHALAARLESPAGEPVVDETTLRSSGAGTTGATVTALRPRVRWNVRMAAAAVAAVIVLATASLRATPGSALYSVRLSVERAAAALSPSQGGVHLRVAEARLDDLLFALRTGPVQAAPGLARSLVRNRASAVRAGADVGDLDLRIALEVPPALLGAPDGIAASVRGVLGSLLPPESTGPSGPAAPGGKRSPGPGQGEGSDHSGENKGRGGLGEHEGSDGNEKSRDHEGSDSDGGSNDHEGSNDVSHPGESPSDGGSDGHGHHSGPRSGGD